MSNEAAVREAKRLTRRYAKFRILRRIVKAVSIISTLAAIAVVPLILMTPNESPWHEAVTVMGAFSPVFAFIVIGGAVLMRNLKEKQSSPIDKRFDNDTYEFLVKYLRSAGVKDPVAYIALEEKHMDAFQRIIKVVVYEIDPPEDYRGEREDQSSRELFEALREEERKVAGLVLPGEKELALETQITKLIKERGIHSLVVIKEILAHTSDQPSVFRDGDL